MANATEEMEETEEETTTITAKELAKILGVDPKTCRRFLRGLTTVHPGKGGRWAIELADLDAVKAAWDAKHSPDAEDETEADDEVIEDLVDEDEDEEDVLDEI